MGQQARQTGASGVRVLGPASAMQAGLLYESTLSGHARAHVEQIVVEMPAVPADRLGQIWQDLATRHQGLRLSLQADETGTLRLVEHLAPRVDLRQIAPPVDLAAFLRDDRAAGADPRSTPGWRVSLLDQGKGRQVMVWTIHHALIDLTGMQIVLQELFACLDGQALPPVQALPLADVVAALDAQDKTKARAFFRAMHADSSGFIPFLHGPRDATPRMAQMSHRLDAALSEALRANMADLGATPLNAVQAAWGLVLARWTGQAEACFGLVEAGRSLVPGSEGTVGCLISTLPLRIGFDPSQTLGSVVAGLRATTLSLRAHAHASAAEIRRWLGLSGQAEVFDTLVMYARGSLATRLSDSVRQVRLLEEGRSGATLAVYDGDEIEIVLEHDSTRLPEAKARAVLDHVTRLLHQMAGAGAATPLGALEMLGPQETEALHSLAHPVQEVRPDLPCLASRFEAVARTTPEGLALIDAADGQSLTYEDLDKRANALAWRIHRSGLGPEDLVALALPRGVDHVVALLAVLKSGAAFLPLDPEQPLSYLRGLCDRAGAKAVIAPQASALGQGGALHLVPDATRHDHPPPRPAPDAARLAYVLHTSGSTGTPKGVMGTCGALSAHADAVIAAYGLTPQDRVLHFAGLAFDVCLEEILPTLLCGARLILRDNRAGESVSGFLDLVARMRLSVLNLPASFWHVLVEEMKQRALGLPPSVRLVISGSERILPQALADWRRLAPGVGWINAYGPTEATISCTAWQDDGSALGAEVPIGRPLGHARVWLRAFDGTLAPLGGEGALWVGGAAVTRGYLGLPDQTARVFVETPLGRLYATGDQARWRGDGALEYLGRRDRQVKLRGHRIDLHQIESVLGGLPGVAQAHVTLENAGADGEGAARLLAWLVCDQGPDGADPDDLRRQAARHLPAYMLPLLIVVDRLSVGPNGKIRTAALPRPAIAGAGETAHALAGADALTRSLAKCMGLVLDIDAVAPDADFHDLGGDSLTAMRLASVIEAQTGKPVSAIDIRNHPTAQGLAQYLRGARQGPRLIVPIQPEGHLPPLFAVHVIGTNGDLFRPLAQALGPAQPVFGLSVGVPRNLDEINVKRSARAYFDELQRHHPQGPLSLIAVSMAAYFAFELAQLLRAAGREVRVLAVLDAMGPDGRPALQGWPKLRAHLRQLRGKGLGHLRAILAHRIEAFQVERERRDSAPDEVTGYNIVAANVRAVESYQPQPYDGRLTIFRADASFWDSPEAIASGLGWASVARGGFDLHDTPGTHLSILQPGQVETLAAHMARLVRQG